MRKIRIFILLTLVTTGSLLYGQSLKRRAMLGIYPAAVSIEEALQNGLDGTTGVKVQKVINHSTASDAGIQQGDIILRIDSFPLEGPNDLFRILQIKREDEEIAVLLKRSGESLQLQARMRARPLPSNPHGEVVATAVPFRDGLLRAFIEKPKGKGPFPTIYFLQGYTCSSVEFIAEWSPFRQLIQQMVAAGYAVFRVEKPGIGDSENTPDCMSIDFEAEMEAFRTAYQFLLEQDFVDTDDLFLYGHSLGGLTAPLLAEEFQPKGVMIYGTGLYAWEDYMIELFRTQGPITGEDYVEMEKQVMAVKPLLHAYFHEGKHPATFSDTERALFCELMGCTGSEIVLNRHHSFWPTLNAVNFVEAWANYQGQVLAMHGEFDIEALDSDAVERIVEIVNHYHPNHGTFELIPKTEHSLLKVENMEDKLALANQPFPSYAQERFNDTYFPILDHWMKTHLHSTTKVKHP